MLEMVEKRKISPAFSELKKNKAFGTRLRVDFFFFLPSVCMRVITRCLRMYLSIGVGGLEGGSRESTWKPARITWLHRNCEGEREREGAECDDTERLMAARTRKFRAER